MTDANRPGTFDEHGGARPNASPELQDAIRSIDAIGENAWGKDDDEDVSRGQPDTDRPDTDQEGTGQPNTDQEGDPNAP